LLHGRIFFKQFIEIMHLFPPRHTKQNSLAFRQGQKGL
jgi:hypothetical protein